MADKLPPPTPDFVQIASAASNYGHSIFGLTPDGRVFEWELRTSGWRPTGEQGVMQFIQIAVSKNEYGIIVYGLTSGGQVYQYESGKWLRLSVPGARPRSMQRHTPHEVHVRRHARRSK